jgi:hypothetical protein
MTDVQVVQRPLWPTGDLTHRENDWRWGTCIAAITVLLVVWISVGVSTIYGDRSGHKAALDRQWRPVTATLVGAGIPMGNGDLGSDVDFTVAGHSYTRVLDLGVAASSSLVAPKTGAEAQILVDTAGDVYGLSAPVATLNRSTIWWTVFGSFCMIPLGLLLGHVSYKTAWMFQRRRRGHWRKSLWRKVYKKVIPPETARHSAVSPEAFYQAMLEMAEEYNPDKNKPVRFRP